jgi:hypothetical protein
MRNKFSLGGYPMLFLINRKSFSHATILFAALLAVLIFTFSICTADTLKGIAANTAKGQILYTQFSLFYEANRHRTTNYRVGTLVPVNTEVKFVNATSRTIIVTLPNGQNLKIENIAEYSGEKIDGIFTRTFDVKPIDLSGFSEDEKKAIMSGEVILGMKKAAVLIALGYPPKHKTPNLELDQWQYWQNRFNTFIVHFENGKVAQIQD